MKVLKKVFAVVLLMGGLNGYTAASEYEGASRFNYVGMDLNLELFSFDNHGVDLMGGGLTAGFQHTPFVFSKVNIHMASETEYSFSKRIDFKQGYNAHIGIKSSGRIFNPFIMGGLGYNHATGELDTFNWIVFDIEAGFKNEVKFDNDKKIAAYLDYSLIFSVTNFDKQLRTMTGINMEMGIITSNKVNIYAQIKAMESNNEFAHRLIAITISSGIKYRY